MKDTFKIILSLSLALMVLVSCGSYKRSTYLQDMDTLTTYQVAERQDLKIHSRDKLNITVSCYSNPSLAEPFSQASGNGAVYVDPQTGRTISTAIDKGYTVDKDGYINFPVIGKIYVEGLTLDNLKKTIEQKIIDIHYIKEPVVNVEFLNFQITMLGEINPGNYIIPGDGINLLEAIALAGDVENTGNIKDLWVIRTDNGQRKVYSVNLRSKSLFESPVFYLQQNDLIYVKPRKTKMDSSVSSVLSWVSMITSVSSILTLILFWTGKISINR